MASQAQAATTLLTAKVYVNALSGVAQVVNGSLAGPSTPPQVGINFGPVVTPLGQPNVRNFSVSLTNLSNSIAGAAPNHSAGVQVFLGRFTGSTTASLYTDVKNADGMAFNYSTSEPELYYRYAPIPAQATSPSKAWSFSVPAGATDFSFTLTVQSLSVRLPNLVQDHMVLQQQATVPIWGWADPGRTVTITAGWGSSAKAVAGADGKWSANFITPSAGGPYTITVSAQDTLVVRDVMIGEVWLCSGQSNMDFPDMLSLNWDPTISDIPNLRLFHLYTKLSSVPNEDAAAAWRVSSPGAARSFSAVGFYFGRMMWQQLGVPIGIIQASLGGTSIQTWMSTSALSTYKGTNPGGDGYPQSSLYNGMIAPLTRFPLRGVLWYQGENNVGEPAAYRQLFQSMIQSWRSVWGNPTMPFYYAQIAPYAGYPFNNNAALLRDAQTATLAVPNTGMAVTTDCAGDATSIHPLDKPDVADRLGRLALKHTYGQTFVVAEGPSLSSATYNGSTVRVVFDNAEGLYCSDTNISEFQIAGADKVFWPATGKITGNSVYLTAPQVPNPVAVRYAWRNAPFPNVFNGTGLPIVPFRTDSW